jgi:formate C-acetyltransferase
MEYILKYIEDNLSAHLTLGSVAAYAGYSTWHFCEKFKAFTGTTFTDYLRSHRMQYAVNALLRGQHPPEIADALGYETVSGFEKAFFKQFGCSPMEYKQNADFYQERYEKERQTRLHPTDRCQILREQATSPGRRWDYAIGLYSYHFWEGFYELPPERRTNYSTQAAGYGAILERLVPVIHKGELIVGETFPSAHTEQMERGIIDLIRKSPHSALDYLKHGPLTPVQIDRLFQWASREDCRWPYVPGKAPYAITEKQQLVISEGAATGNCCVDAHCIPDYEKVLRIGFRGILKELEIASQKQGLDERQQEFYDGSIRICRACCGIGEKYSLLADALSEHAETSNRAEELRKISKICRRVPAEPAETFYEAVQSLYFAHMINTLEDGVNANSLGRLDQILYPYYRHDLEAGIIKREEAFELICCLWLKLYRNYDVQQCTIGGCTPDGCDASNELSFLMLDATEELDIVRCMSVRYGTYTSHAFLRRAFEVLCHVNKGINSFYNDDVMIPALTRRKISLPDARDYAVIGCTELCIPGKSNAHPATARCNLIKALEYALTGGESMLHSGRYPGIRQRTVNYRSFSSLKRAVLMQLDALLNDSAELTRRETKIRAQEWPQFYKSILTDGCISAGRSYCDQGAKYDFDEVMLLGLPNLADALMVLQRLVFEEHRYTLPQLVTALRQDFPDEAMRQELLNGVPKYGNGIRCVDTLAAELMEHACKYLESIPSDVSDGYFPQMLSYRWSIDHGALTPATPDGRHAFTPLADGVSPMRERDFNGVAAVLQSVSALPAGLSPGGFSATIEVDSVLFSDCHLDLLLDLFLRASASGLGSVQYNIQDSKQDASGLEVRRNLAVQVFGYRQQYDQLDKEIRDYISERTKHQLL